MDQFHDQLKCKAKRVSGEQLLLPIIIIQVEFIVMYHQQPTTQMKFVAMIAEQTSE